LRALLELPFERVIVSHGELVHTRAAYERALELAPWERIVHHATAGCQYV
jgi:alkylated DNA nucleotide flippase Atl1